MWEIGLRVKNGSSKGQNLALTVLSVLYSLVRGVWGSVSYAIPDVPLLLLTAGHRLGGAAPERSRRSKKVRGQNLASESGDF